MFEAICFANIVDTDVLDSLVIGIFQQYSSSFFSSVIDAVKGDISTIPPSPNLNGI